MKNYVEVLNEAIPGITVDDINTPFNESNIHSLDSIILRDALEKHYGFEIPDNDWYGFEALSDTLAYCDNKKANTRTQTIVTGEATLIRDYTIGLPHMANNGLSESWLLKELGDIHWEMLSKGLEQKSSELKDCKGNRLYAAFARVNYTIDPLNGFRENGELKMAGRIKRYGDYAYYSSIHGNSGENMIAANMMSSFSFRQAGDNAKITRGMLSNSVNHIEELNGTPDFYLEHRAVNRNKVNELVSGGYTFRITDNEIESTVHNINPYYEINGVGLLYFAAYPIIADGCASTFFKHVLEMKNYERNFHTIYRDTFYFGNCNADDRIIIKLNTAEVLDGDKLKLVTSMYRESDNKLIARVFTVKQKQGTA